ncbi:MAG: lactonase family protein, partial [Acidimicrobiia bacterium]
LYVGTYTSGESKGIYRFHLDPATGALSPAGDPTEAVNPSFLAFHPSRRFLYAVNETGDAPKDPSGAVSAFAIDPATGGLTFLNQQPSGGPAPCHLTIDKEGRHALVANYWGATVAVLPIQADGRLGPATTVVRHEGRSVNPERQAEPHPHSINLDPANRFAFVADLGLDKLAAYRFDGKKGLLARHDPGTVGLKPGAGPRHLSFHPDGRRAYVINELDSSITRLAYDAGDGAMKAVQNVPTLPAGFQGRNITAEIAVHPDGTLLYGSNRGHDSIAIFTIDKATGALTATGHQPTGGKTPRNFAIDPTGAYLLAANQESDTIAVFRIDRASGRLAPAGRPVRVPRPVCLRMMR